MPTDATFQDVIDRVQSHGALQDLISCSFMDEEMCDDESSDGLCQTIVNYGHVLGWHGDWDDRYLDMNHLRKKFKYGLAPLKEKIRASSSKEISRLAETAARQRDGVSFDEVMKAIHRRGRTVDKIVLRSAVCAIGTMCFGNDCDKGQCKIDSWLSSIHEYVKDRVQDSTRTWGGHSRSTFERLFEHMIYSVHSSAGNVSNVTFLLSLYPQWAAKSLCNLWREQESPMLRVALGAGGRLVRTRGGAYEFGDENGWLESMRRLARCTIQEMQRASTVAGSRTKRQQVCALLEVVGACVGDGAGSAIDTLRVFARHDILFIGGTARRIHRSEVRAWKVALILARAELHDNRQRCFLEWLDASEVYAPKIFDGQSVAPPVVLAELALMCGDLMDTGP